MERNCKLILEYMEDGMTVPQIAEKIKMDDVDNCRKYVKKLVKQYCLLDEQKINRRCYYYKKAN